MLRATVTKKFCLIYPKAATSLKLGLGTYQPAYDAEDNLFSLKCKSPGTSLVPGLFT
jgi:hypothetical protein